MAKKQEDQEQEKAVTLERGDIFFFYRPKVEEEDPDSLSDVQRMYMVLKPENKKKVRLAIVGKKRLPDPNKSGKGRNWGFVETVRNSPDFLKEEFAQESYQTKTRGERHTPPARPLGEGVYRIVRHSGHTHLVYALELPESPGPAQEETRIEDQASYIISIKNPEKGSPVATGLSEDRKAEYPRKLQEKFRDRRFADADPPEFLDKEGTQFILASASEDIEDELDINMRPEDESIDQAGIFSQLHLDRSERPTKPLSEGDWA